MEPAFEKFRIGVKIVDAARNRTVSAELVSDPGLKELYETEKEWGVYRSGAIAQFRLDDPNRPESAHWNWVRKFSGRPARTFRICSLVAEKSVQGLLMICTDPTSGHTATSQKEMFLYISFLESAPWNLREYVGANIKYSGVGSALLRCAVALSFDMGCQGRLMLTALPNAERFYLKRKFEHVGWDAHEKLNVYELNASNALAVLEGRS